MSRLMLLNLSTGEASTIGIQDIEFNDNAVAYPALDEPLPYPYKICTLEVTFLDPSPAYVALTTGMPETYITLTQSQQLDWLRSMA